MNKRTVVITGATVALGNRVAKTFADMGHNLALLDNDQNKLDSLLKELNLPDECLFEFIVWHAGFFINEPQPLFPP